MTALLKYDAACRAVAEAKTFDEVRDWENKAEAIREYSRRAHNRGMELDCLEIRERARRRRGELLLELKSEGQLQRGRPNNLVNQRGNLTTLESLGLSFDESSRDQQIAAIEESQFETLLALGRARLEAEERKHSLDVLRQRDGPVNGARSVMGSRQEPDDSLDYFPTPPWATRALVERVIPLFQTRGEWLGERIWEPACGEGHIAEVLAEYTPNVMASDIFDYGYDGAGYDFLTDVPFACDWIITNPPFGEKTEAFVLRALKLADVGVAMFVRLQWLESVGRYETIFRDHPPTLIAFFAERVNLCKGRWDPEGTTATAYIWLVWIKGQKPRAPFWIPPGQREALTHPDDVERFTVHPVIKKNHTIENAAELMESPAASEPACDPASPHSQQSHAGSPISADDVGDIPTCLRVGHPDNAWRSALD